MAAGTTRKITAASVRTHTRKSKPKPTSKSAGWFKTLVLVGFVGFLAWAYQATRPPPAKICGSPGGPPVTALRVQLKDGRFLAYVEHGVSKETAKHKIVFIHGFDSCRHDDSAIMENLSPDTIQSKGIYMVSFDRPGYGESDPHPTQTFKSLAHDIEELADLLGLGSKFYVVGFSIGGQIVWTCLKYIPHRLAGAALISPAINYWWPGLPSNVSKQGFEQHLVPDQWALRVVHYMPWLTYWWNTQKLFPVLSIISRSPQVLSSQDKNILPKMMTIRKDFMELSRLQGEHESLHRDLMIRFGKWEFGPTELVNPFSGGGGGSVHMWQGDADLLVPVDMQRYIASQLPWIHYHEVAGIGHLLPFGDGMAESIVQALLA